MLKMIIADDEKAIRESINASIDWASLGIQIVGLAKNAAEAYDLILDEYPDIVLTDIRMPGFSGLELIARTAQTHPQTEFIILSGYGEFEYAKEAMECGVRHYLLKPCSPEQLIQTIQQVRNECFQKRSLLDMQSKQRKLLNTLRQGLVRNSLIDAFSARKTIDDITESGSPYLDFDNMSYELLWLTPVRHAELAELTGKLPILRYENTSFLQTFHAGNTLYTIFETLSQNDYEEFKRAISNATAGLHVGHASFSSLRLLLEHLIETIHDCDQITILDHSTRTTLKNYSVFIEKIQKLFDGLSQNPNSLDLQKQLQSLISGVNDRGFQELLISNAMIRGIELPEKLYLQAGLQPLTHILEQNSVVDAVKRSVAQHLTDPALSLKWLAENHLYMNADYLSKQFTKQTGERFSTYVNRKRVARAKELLQENEGYIYTIAEQVGFANNPQYFSQIFKRFTGMTPSEFLLSKSSDTGAV